MPCGGTGMLLTPGEDCITDVEILALDMLPSDFSCMYAQR